MKEINILKQILSLKSHGGASALPYKLLRDDQETDSISNATHLEFEGTKCDLEELVYPLKESGDEPKHSLKTLLFLLSQEWEGFGAYLTQCLTSGISSLGLLEFQPTLLYLQSLKNEPLESEVVQDGSNQKKFKTSADSLDPVDQFLNTVLKNETALATPDSIYGATGVQTYHWIVDLIDKSVDKSVDLSDKPSQKQPPCPGGEYESDPKSVQSTQDQPSTTSAETKNLPIILLSSNKRALVNINNVVSFLSVGKLSDKPTKGGTSGCTHDRICHTEQSKSFVKESQAAGPFPYHLVNSNSPLLYNSSLVANIPHPATGQSQQYRIKYISDWKPVNSKEEQRVRLLLTSISDDINELGWKGKYPCVIVYDKLQDRPPFWHTLATDEEIFKLEVDGDDNIDQLRMMWEFERVKI
ncbi:hypothetical protein CONCODRAFT_166432 [Conidiobolus coronatus NRRL 28638]|uniref:Uncharacterized protein n=1 Tax=Conidiobolus coronatus (strain ATCC 28846 / CBS 209.66 / NRRL 28638) TaxID=796925 RepID=A0A137P0L0_CONC2|nr:hypothetical protein CONCODRAFT_166432 [Conidiobolus coronatus NRRL 28638]|eukprot:KXN68567.1 hypothetical protein CONCODRAFT_166432 [Conidiobolus coronatus NRRL 28638]